MNPFDLVVVGGGAAGFMTAVTAAENGVKRIIILEGSSKLMEKVRISGGGRCNVTNASWIPNELLCCRSREKSSESPPLLDPRKSHLH